MTMPELPRRKAARLFRRCPTGHDGARSKSACAPVLAYQSAPVDPAEPFKRSSLLPAKLRNRYHRSPAPRSTSLAAALKSP